MPFVKRYFGGRRPCSAAQAQGFVIQFFSCSFNAIDHVYELAGLLTVLFLPVPFLNAAEFVDHAAAIGFVSPFPCSIKTCSFSLFDLNLAKMKCKVLERTPFQGDKVAIYTIGKAVICSRIKLHRLSIKIFK